jgi:hypothetical protein
MLVMDFSSGMGHTGATRLKSRLSKRFSEVGLALNAGKTNIAYIDTFKRRNVAPSFTFLGYDFKVRTLKNFKGDFAVQKMHARCVECSNVQNNRNDQELAYSSLNS